MNVMGLMFFTNEHGQKCCTMFFSQKEFNDRKRIFNKYGTKFSYRYYIDYNLLEKDFKNCGN